MKIYAISGLGADERVFKYLSLEHELVPISWIKPQNKESIIDYSQRLIDKYDLRNEKDFGVLGVSFGGLIATEISKLLNPIFTILISSAETRDNLNGVIKLVGKSKLIELIPERLFNPPKPIAHFLFGTDKKELLNSILDDTDLNFAKWATRALINWQNQTSLSNLIKIGGSKDKLLAPKGKNTIIIENGEHFMIVDRADEISEIINEKIKTYYNNK
ncbi:MAG: alpha/beta hydrolase [Putridiphycobacter sp.]|nr:alpha/beta hydrolase [Putridiphycobacter sp.]